MVLDRLVVPHLSSSDLCTRLFVCLENSLTMLYDFHEEMSEFLKNVPDTLGDR